MNTYSCKYKRIKLLYGLNALEPIVSFSFALAVDLRRIRCGVGGKSLAPHSYLGRTEAENHVLQCLCLSAGIRVLH